MFKLDVEMDEILAISAYIDSCVHVWHARLCHVNYMDMWKTSIV